MPHSNVISGSSEQEMFKTVEEQLKNKKDDRDYSVEFSIHNHTVNIDIDYHASTDDDEMSGTTLITAPLSSDVAFRFALTKQTLKSNVKKLFGMQDVIVGNAELDRKFIIQSNDEARVKELLSDPEISGPLVEFPIIIFEVRELKIGATQETVLTYDVEGRITDAARLQRVFAPFGKVLTYLK